MSQCGHWMAAEPNEDFQNGEVPWKPVCRLSKYSLVSTCMRVPRISLRRRVCQRDGPAPTALSKCMCRVEWVKLFGFEGLECWH